MSKVSIGWSPKGTATYQAEQQNCGTLNVVWEPCGRCWGQRVVFYPVGVGRLCEKRTCRDCLGLGSVPMVAR